MKRKLQNRQVVSGGRALQPIELDVEGVPRFRANEIVRFLLDAGPFDMNKLTLMPFSASDREQFAQLIGYSVSGFGELDYASTEAMREADKIAEALSSKLCGNRSTPFPDTEYKHTCIRPKGHKGPHRSSPRYNGRIYHWTWTKNQTCAVREKR